MARMSMKESGENNPLSKIYSLAQKSHLKTMKTLSVKSSASSSIAATWLQKDSHAITKA